MATTKSYNPLDWQITFAGILIQGFATGTKLKVTREVASVEKTVGQDGDVVFVGKNDRSGKVELTLQRESPTNALLSAKLAAFEARPRTVGAGMGPFLAKNINSIGTIAVAANAVIEKWPDMEAADTASTCVWSLLLDDVTMFEGGAVA
jgi:hypothetical protein